MAKKRKQVQVDEQYRWRITKTTGTTANVLGFVSAGTESEALRKGFEKFKVSGPDRRWISAQRDG